MCVCTCVCLCVSVYPGWNPESGLGISNLQKLDKKKQSGQKRSREKRKKADERKREKGRARESEKKIFLKNKK